MIALLTLALLGSSSAIRLRLFSEEATPKVNYMSDPGIRQHFEEKGVQLHISKGASGSKRAFAESGMACQSKPTASTAYSIFLNMLPSTRKVAAEQVGFLGDLNDELFLKSMDAMPEHLPNGVKWCLVAEDPLGKTFTETIIRAITVPGLWLGNSKDVDWVACEDCDSAEEFLADPSGKIYYTDPKRWVKAQKNHPEGTGPYIPGVPNRAGEVPFVGNVYDPCFQCFPGDSACKEACKDPCARWTCQQDVICTQRCMTRGSSMVGREQRREARAQAQAAEEQGREPHGGVAEDYMADIDEQQKAQEKAVKDMMKHLKSDKKLQKQISQGADGWRAGKKYSGWNWATDQMGKAVGIESDDEDSGKNPLLDSAIASMSGPNAEANAEAAAAAFAPFADAAAGAVDKAIEGVGEGLDEDASEEGLEALKKHGKNKHKLHKNQIYENL